MCRQCAWAALQNAAAVAAAEGPMFATHVNIWQSITPPPTIFSCSGLWNEGTNKLAFYVYLCVGVSEGGDFIFLGNSAQPESATKRGREKRKKGWMFWSHDSSPDCPNCLSCAKHDPPLPQPRQKHRRLDKHYFMQWLDESSDSNYSLPLAPTKLYCTGSFFDTKLQ